MNKKSQSTTLRLTTITYLPKHTHRLHRLLIVKTGGNIGILNKKTKTDSIYPTNIHFEQTYPTPDEIQSNQFTTYDEKLKYFISINPDAGDISLFDRGATNLRGNSDMLRKRFLFYPPKVCEQFVFHCCRHGMFITATVQFAKRNGWDVSNAMRAAHYLGAWR